MSASHNNIQLQYEGYANTNLLWKNKSVFGLRQFEIPTHPELLLDETFPDKMRLGFRVERFIGADLRRMNNVEILEENIQIRDKQRTIGEIDCLLLYKGKPIHLEIIFKLYLYDPTIGSTEIEHWIGGNRTDSFFKKLTKLKDKQLPLLYNENTKHIIESHNIKVEDITQRVHFKAQLYKPYKEEVGFKHLNKECLKGFYIRPNQLTRFQKCAFYIPLKNDWLVDPHLNVDWQDYDSFKEKIESIMPYKSYPLCWIKFPDDNLQKFFIVWWDNTL